MSESSDALRLMARDEDEAVRRVRLAFSGLLSAAGEIDRLDDRLAAIERQVLWRTEDMPPDAVAWWKRTWGNGEMECRYMNEDGDELHPEAPDHLPDDPVGPLFLPILDPEKERHCRTKSTASAPPTVPWVVSRWPSKLRRQAREHTETAERYQTLYPDLARVHKASAACKTVLADELDRALAQHSEPGRVPEGWKLVPVEPTKNMVEAFYRSHERAMSRGRWESPFSNAWEALIAAAPAPDAEKNDAD